MAIVIGHRSLCCSWSRRTDLECIRNLELGEQADEHDSSRPRAFWMQIMASDRIKTNRLSYEHNLLARKGEGQRKKSKQTEDAEKVQAN